MAAPQLGKETLDKIANFLRNGKGGVPCNDGACFQRRIEFFRGDEMVDCLQSQHFGKQKLLPAGTPTPLSREGALNVAQQLLSQRDYFHSANWTNKEKALDELYVLQPRDGSVHNFEDNEDAMYIWILPVSKTKALIQSGLFVLAMVCLAAIKAWPIWMKVIVWWCSLIMLVCLLSLSVLRLVLYSVFWLIGFRGIWLLPNMFNDDLDFLDAFYPLFGKAVSQKELAKQAKQKRLATKAAEIEAAKQAKLAKKGGLKGSATTTTTTTTTTTVPATPTGDKVKADGDKAKEEGDNKQAKEAPAEPKKPGRCDGYNFGLINLCGILICGLIFCNYTGMFMPEMIPDFVVSKQELFAQFPSLAPPDYNATAEEEASKKSDEPIIPNLDSLLEESEELRTDDSPRTLSEELEEEVIDDVVQEE